MARNAISASGIDAAAEAVIARYGALSGDAAGFARALVEPLPVCLWANPLRLEPDDLAKRLADDGMTPEPVGWRSAPPGWAHADAPSGGAANSPAEVNF